MTTRHPFAPPSRQSGAVLVVGLILLLMMTLMMIVAMGGTILQERMAGALRNESIAEVGADSALRDGELWLWKQIEAAGAQIPASSAGFPLSPDAPLARTYRSATQWTSGGQEYGTGGAGIRFPTSDYYMMARTPAFIVESLGAVNRQDPVETSGGNTETINETFHYYRITARSTGGTENVVRLAESTFSISLFE